MKQMDLVSVNYTPHCKRCGSHNIVRYGRYLKHIPKYLCKRCGAVCVFAGSDLFRMRKQSWIIGFAVELYSRGGISLRTIADIITKHFQISVSYVAVFNWVQKGAGSPWIPHLEPEYSPVWYVDETVIKVNRIDHWLIMVYCPTNKLILGWELSRERSSIAIQTALRRAIENAGFRPKEVISDGYNAYPRAVKKVMGWRFVKHIVIEEFHENNPIERQFREVKRRVKWFSTFRNVEAARNFFTIFFFAYNFLKPKTIVEWLPCMRWKKNKLEVAQLFKFYPP